MTTDTPQSQDWLFRAIVEHAPFGVLIYRLVDPADSSSLVLTHINRNAERHLSRAASALVGKRILEAFPNLEDTEVPETFRRALRIQASVDLGDVEYNDEHVEASTFEVKATPLSEDTLLVSFTEVTKLRKAERKLHDLAEALNHALRDKQLQLVQLDKMAALGSLLAGIAHELRTPIAAIRSNNDTIGRSLERAEVLTEEVELPKKLKKLLSIMGKLTDTNTTALERIIHLVAGLKRVARADDLERHPADIHECIESTLIILRHELKSRIKIVKELGDIPKCRCHPGQLSQVFTNVLVNAAQAMEKGTIYIRTRARPDDRIEVEIEDEGPGIPPDVLEQIFEAGFTTKERGRGTGLGLAISSEIVRAHGGEIKVETEVGRGTTFRIIVPVEPPEPEALEPSETLPPHPSRC